MANYTKLGCFQNQMGDTITWINIEIDIFWLNIVILIIYVIADKYF
jgi:hypothetical protein